MKINWLDSKRFPNYSNIPIPQMPACIVVLGECKF